MVTPLREMPGTRARVWVAPTAAPSMKVNLRLFSSRVAGWGGGLLGRVSGGWSLLGTFFNDVAHQHSNAVQYQGRGDQPGIFGVFEQLAEVLFEDQADEANHHAACHQQPGQLAVGVVDELPPLQTPHIGRQDLLPVFPEIDEQRKGGGEMQGNDEGQELGIFGLAHVPTQHAREENCLCKAADRKQLGDPLKRTQKKPLCQSHKAAKSTRRLDVWPADR